MAIRMFAASRTRPCAAACVAVVAFLCLAGALAGQELEPRAYSPAPTGTNFIVLALGYTGGSVLLDPSVPITDASARIGTGAVSFARSFGLAGRLASLTVLMPYAVGTMSGLVEEEYTEAHRSGFGDGRFRLAVNLLGGPALKTQDFVRRKPVPTLGASVIVSVPLGQYDPALLVNIGTNRWAFKPELGLSVPSGKWVFDLAAGVWLFTDNDNFFGGQLRTQDPLWAVQGHVSYNFRRGLWVAGDATFYTGGRTSVGGAVKDDRQANSRCGVTLAVPIAKAYALKLGASTGVSTRIGGRFTTVGVAFQYRWFDR